MTPSPMPSPGGAPLTASSGVSCASPEREKRDDCAPWSFALTHDSSGCGSTPHSPPAVSVPPGPWTTHARRDRGVNVGQFVRTLPWGWVVLDGHQFLAPGSGPLATAVAVDSSGAVRWIGPDSLGNPDVRRGAVSAFQSYPTLLDAEGEIPPPLREPGRGIDVEHRDARLGIGALADGRLLIVLTRFDALGESLGSIPFGPTIPEFAALMGALGARQAVALDGGISGQMLVRDADGTHAWRGLRKVPMALVVLKKR